MPPTVATASGPVLLVFGEDEFGVKQRARQVYQDWCAAVGGIDHEVLDATAANSGEALKAMARLREALQTLPFFGGGKVIWLQNCNFLGDERAASARAVTDTLGEIAQELKQFTWENVRLLISAGKVDKRKVFYKTVEKLGGVEVFAGWSADDKDWSSQAERWAAGQLRERKKDIADEALALLVNYVGPHIRQLSNEVEKLAVYVGDRAEIAAADVEAIVTRNKQARAFALADAVGDRDLPRVLRALDEELWEIQFDSKRSEIGLLYGLISKVRVMIFLKEMVEAGWLKAEGDYNRFKTQLARVPVEALPEDKRINPLAMNPYVLFRALPQSRRYSQAELIRAMDLLLACNRRLVSSGLEEKLVLQQALTEIVQRANPATSPPAARPGVR